jgi:hypothetical protein
VSEQSAQAPAVAVVESVEVTPEQRRRSAIAAAVAMTPGLAISWWSFTAYITAGGAPFWLAAVSSASVDGIAIYAALYAAWFTDNNKPARLAKSATYAMVAASAFVNWMHATSMHWSVGLHVALTVPSIGAAVALELALLRMRVVARSRREQRRETRQGVKVDAILRLRHPVLVFKLRRAEGKRLLHEAFETAAIPAATTDTGAATHAANGPDTDGQSSGQDSGQTAATKRPRKRSTAGQDAATKTAKFAAKNPDMPTADLAKKLGLSDRTVRRHLAQASPAGLPLVSHANGSATA